jgi:cytochrome c5
VVASRRACQAANLAPARRATDVDKLRSRSSPRGRGPVRRRCNMCHSAPVQH